MRDVKLENGGIVFDSTLKSEKTVEGIDAVLQRIEIALSVDKGDFPYNREMGVYIPNLDLTQERDILNLEMYINEAIYNIYECSCKVLSVKSEKNTVKLIITANGETYEKEVKLGGKL